MEGNVSRSYSYAARRNQPNDVRPIQGKQTRTCIFVKYRRHRLHALLDTGSDITVSGNNLAKKFKWEICPHPKKSVKIANGEEIVIYAAVYVPLRVGKKDIDSKILISPDITGLIIGIDCMEKQGYSWDFRQQRIMIEDGEWLELKHEHDASGIRRIYVSEDTILPPSQ